MSSASLVHFHPDPASYLEESLDVSSVTATVPAVRPADADVARRWARVVDEQFDALRPRAEGARLVVALSPAVEGPARVFARHSGSRLVVCEDVESAAAAAGDAQERAVVIVALAADLTVARLMQISRRCATQRKPRGFLTGRRLPEVAFAVAKALLRPRSDLGGTTLIDAPSHRAADNRKGLDGSPLTRLMGQSRVKVIRSHGEGGHAKLPGTVVCGLVGGAEFPERPDLGCHEEARRCKRAAGGSDVVFAHEVRAPVVAFICCNGFNVAGELYPSPVSMALGLAEGWTQALISPIRPLVAPDTMVADLQEQLHAGVAYGDVVSRMNELSELLGQPDAFVLHGDPLDRLDAAEVERTSAVVTPPVVTATEVDWIFRALAQSERGARLLRSVRAWLGSEAPEAVTQLAGQLAKVDGMLLNALKWSESLPTGESNSRQARSRTLVGSAVASWDRAMSHLLLEGREVFDAYDLGHYDQRLVELRVGSPCRRCGTPTEVSTFSADRGADDVRQAETCVICGPLSEGRRDGLRIVVVASTPAGSPGDEFSLRVRVTAPVGGSVVRSVHLRLRFFDKASGRCVADESRSVAAGDQEIEFGFGLPEDLGADLHSVRIVAVSGCDVAYARARFVGRPTGGRGR